MVEPKREELIEIYKYSIEEYRFQVNLNWSRTQYYIVLNIGILGVATGILQLEKKNLAFLASGLFFAGVVCCLLSLAAAEVQQGYYRRTREHKRVIELALGLGPYELRTTPGMGSTIRRLGRVTTFNNVILAIICVLDIAGVVLGIRAASTPASATPPAVAVRPVNISDPPQETPPQRKPRTIPVCGTGDIPDGQHLWLFVYGAQSHRYYPQGKVEPQHIGYWVIPNVDLGSSGSLENLNYFSLYTIVTDDSASKQLDQALPLRADEGYSENEWRDLFQKFAVGGITSVQRDDSVESKSRC